MKTLVDFHIPASEARQLLKVAAFPHRGVIASVQQGHGRHMWYLPYGCTEPIPAARPRIATPGKMAKETVHFRVAVRIRYAPGGRKVAIGVARRLLEHSRSHSSDPLPTRVSLIRPLPTCGH